MTLERRLVLACLKCREILSPSRVPVFEVFDLVTADESESDVFVVPLFKHIDKSDLQQLIQASPPARCSFQCLLCPSVLSVLTLLKPFKLLSYSRLNQASFSGDRFSPLTSSEMPDSAEMTNLA